MNKEVLLILCMCLLSYPAIAQDETYTDTNKNVQQQNTNNEPTTQPEGSESDWNLLYDQLVNERYGSIESPAFLNRENMNPNESNYGYSGGY